MPDNSSLSFRITNSHNIFLSVCYSLTTSLYFLSSDYIYYSKAILYNSLLVLNSINSSAYSSDNFDFDYSDNLFIVFLNAGPFDKQLFLLFFLVCRIFDKSFYDNNRFSSSFVFRCNRNCFNLCSFYSFTISLSFYRFFRFICKYSLFFSYFNF